LPLIAHRRRNRLFNQNARFFSFIFRFINSISRFAVRPNLHGGLFDRRHFVYDCSHNHHRSHNHLGQVDLLDYDHQDLFVFFLSVCFVLSSTSAELFIALFLQNLPRPSSSLFDGALSGPSRPHLDSIQFVFYFNHHFKYDLFSSKLLASNRHQ
jgi:hypothetical protein